MTDFLKNILLISLMIVCSSCSLIANLIQNRIDPVVYPTEGRSQSVRISGGFPAELGLSYHPTRNTLLHSYMHTTSLKPDIGELPAPNDYKISAGLSAHLVRKLSVLNMSAGLGLDLGSSRGEDLVNTTQGKLKTQSDYLEKHDLYFWQPYIQVASGLEFQSGFGLGIVLKSGNSFISYNSGVLRDPEGAAYDISGIRKTSSFFHAAFVIKKNIGPLEYQIQLKTGGSDDNTFFYTAGGVSLLVSYTFPEKKHTRSSSSGKKRK
ncbi:MAG: hypothetical protein H6618_04925 [Deltaproteobacteria bacterium]|nr:hypothetical protein [Deltaproteobacteria bacterium]